MGVVSVQNSTVEGWDNTGGVKQKRGLLLPGLGASWTGCLDVSLAFFHIGCTTMLPGNCSDLTAGGVTDGGD
jgi:hypothetical protein